MIASHSQTAQTLIIKGPTVTSDKTNADVLDVFGLHRDLISLPVLEVDRPIGLISRGIFMSQMSKPYYRELYEKKSCIAFMDKSPLIVEVDTPVETLATRAVESGYKTLADGFVIVDKGRFAGVGTGLDLMHALAALQAEKNHQIMLSIDYASNIQRAMLSESRNALYAVFFWFDRATRRLTSSHANMALLVMRPSASEILSIKGERTGLSYADTRADMAWKNHETQLEAGTLLCCCTDGLIDQIGGRKNIAFGNRRLRQALQRHRDLPIAELTHQLMNEFESYQGGQSRRDDLTLFNLRVD